MRTLAKYLLSIALMAGFTILTEEGAAQDSGKFGNNVVVHIAMVVRDVEKSAQAYADLFGVDVPKVSLTDPQEKTNMQFRGKPAEGRAKLAFLQLENITVELIEPVGGPSTWQEFLEEKGEGVHHMAFRVKGMEEHIARLENGDGKLIQQGDFTDGSYAYVDLTQQLGVIVELLTSTKGK